MRKTIFKTIVLISVFICCILVFVACDQSGNGGEQNVNDEFTIEDFDKIEDETYGYIYSLNIPNSTLIYNLNNVVSVGNKSWTVSTDISGKEVIPSKIVEPNVGENIYFIQVKDLNNNVENFVIKIIRNRTIMFTLYIDSYNYWKVVNVECGAKLNLDEVGEPTRRGYTFAGWDKELNYPITTESINYAIAQWTANKYTVSLDLDGGTYNKTSQEMTYGANYSLDTPVKTNYEFLGWYYNDRKIDSTGTWSIAEDITIKAKWEVKAYVPVTVNYYLENLDDDNYTLFDTRTQYGKPNKTVIGDKTIDENGFILPKDESVVAVDGQDNIINYYYDRKMVTVKFVANNGTRITDQEVKYGTDTSKLTKPSRSDRNFVGWYSEADLETKSTNIVSDYNVTLYAAWQGETRPKDFSVYNKSMINKYYGKDVNVVIPKYYNDVLIEGVDRYAFSGRKDVKSIILQEGIKSIDIFAFQYCSALEKLYLPLSIETVSDSMLQYAENAIIYTKYGSKPGTWSSGFNFGRPIVWDCENNDIAHDGAIYVFGENGVAYSIKDNEAKVVNQNKNLSGDLIIAGKLIYKNKTYAVKKVDDRAFYNCKYIKSIVFEDGVETIGQYAFDSCSLRSIVLPNTLTSVGNYTFNYCKNLNSVTMPESLKSIGKYMFDGCSSLVSIDISDVDTIGEFAFYNCSNLKDVKMPIHPISVGYGVFQACSMLQKIVLPQITYFGGQLFNYCHINLHIYYLENSIDQKWAQTLSSEGELYLFSDTYRTVEIPYISGYWHYVESAPIIW